MGWTAQVTAEQTSRSGRTGRAESRRLLQRARHPCRVIEHSQDRTKQDHANGCQEGAATAQVVAVAIASGLCVGTITRPMSDKN